MKWGGFGRRVDRNLHPVFWIIWRGTRLLALFVMLSSLVIWVAYFAMVRRASPPSHQLKWGMTKDEVRALLGAPSTIIESDLWFYGSDEHPSLIFERERLVRVGEIGKGEKHPVNVAAAAQNAANSSTRRP